MRSVERLNFLTQGDPVPERVRRKAMRNLARFKLSEIHDPEERSLTASHEAAHALISILTGENILDVWVSEFSSKVNRVLGIYEGHVAAFETSVYMAQGDQDTFRPRDLNDASTREVLLDAVNFLIGHLNEHVLFPKKLDLEKIEENAMTPIDNDEDDFSLFQESFLNFLERNYPDFPDLTTDEREILYKEALDLFLQSLLDFLRQDYIQKVTQGIARKFLKESRMRGPQVKEQILQALREEGIFGEDLDLMKDDLGQRMDLFEANLEKKLANLLESP